MFFVLFFRSFLSGKTEENNENDSFEQWFPLRYGIIEENNSLLPHFKINFNKYGSVYWKKYKRAMQRTNKIDINTLNQLSERNYAPAVHTLGELYENGYKLNEKHVISRNLSKALLYFKKGAKLGYPESYSSLGFYFRYGIAMKNSDRLMAEIYNNLGCSKNSVRSMLTNAASHTFGISLPYSLTKSSSILMKVSTALSKALDSDNVEEKTLRRMPEDMILKETTNEDIENQKVRNYLKYMSTSSPLHDVDYGMIKYLGKYGEKVDYRAAKEIFERHQDNGKALGLLGRMYHFGHGVEEDLEKAEMYYQRGAEYEDPIALTGLGLLKLKEEDVESASKYFVNASQRGGIGAEYNYAVIMLNGNKQIAKNVSKALEILNRLCESQMIQATHTLAILSLTGKPTHDEKKSVKLFWRIMRKGIWNNIGQRAEKEYQKKDYEQALLHWMELGDMGIERAAYNAGLMLYHWKKFFKIPPLGMKEFQIYETSKRFLKLSRKLGYVDSSIYVSRLYFMNGEEEKGIRWLEDGSLNSPNVTIEVAKVILEGVHMQRNYTKLRECFNKINSTAVFISLLPDITDRVIIDTVSSINEILGNIEPMKAKEKLNDIFEFVSIINKERLLFYVNLILLVSLVRKRIDVFYKED